VIIFWAVCALMVIVALLYTLWPLLKPGRAGAVDELQARITASKANLYELEQDVKNDNLAAADLRVAREEIALALYQSTAKRKAKQLVAQPGNLLSLLLVSLLVPVVAVLIYLQLGQRQLVDGGTPVRPASVEAMVLGLAESLKQRPDDVGGWTILARFYTGLGRYDEAISAYEHLYSIAADKPTVLVGYAEALSMANAGDLSGRPQELLDQALQLAPLNKAGLWLSGLAARQAGEEAAAIGFWRELMPQLQDDDQALQQIKQLIAESEARAGKLPTAAEEAPESGTNKPEVIVKGGAD